MKISHKIRKSKHCAEIRKKDSGASCKARRGQNGVKPPAHNGPDCEFPIKLFVNEEEQVMKRNFFLNYAA
jgi:hypothetical protein